VLLVNKKAFLQRIKAHEQLAGATAAEETTGSYLEQGNWSKNIL